jgi:hypothetical protein
MESAIDLVKSKDNFHAHIGIYSKVLGEQRQAVIKRKLQLTPINLSANKSVRVEITESNIVPVV